MRAAVCQLGSVVLLAAACHRAPAGDTPSDGPLATVLREDAAGRLVEHPGGTDLLPLQPQRIAAFGIAADDLVTLGIAPAIVGTRWQHDVADYLAPFVRDALRIGATGYTTGISVEQVLAAHPDLILVGDALQYRLLREVAPTMVVARQWADVAPYEPRVRALAAALGMAELGEAALAAHQQRVERLAAPVRQRLGGVSFALMHVHGHELRLHGSQVLDRIGALTGMVPDHAVRDRLGVDGGFVNEEFLGAMRAEVLIAAVDVRALGATRTFDRLMHDPLLAAVPAVRECRVLEVESFAWLFRSAIATEQILQDLNAALPRLAPPPR